jgi:hypothetical protein
MGTAGARSRPNMPRPPYARGSGTSEAAAEQLRTRLQHGRSIIDLAAERSDQGILADDADAILGLGHATASARVHDLGEEANALVRAGVRRRTRRGRNAEVYRLPPDTTADQAFAIYASWTASNAQPRRRAATQRRLIMTRGREWVAAHDTENVQDALNALLDAVWNAFGSGDRPLPWRAEEDWAPQE